VRASSLLCTSKRGECLQQLIDMSKTGRQDACITICDLSANCGAGFQPALHKQTG